VIVKIWLNENLNPIILGEELTENFRGLLKELGLSDSQINSLEIEICLSEIADFAGYYAGSKGDIYWIEINKKLVLANSDLSKRYGGSHAFNATLIHEMAHLVCDVLEPGPKDRHGFSRRPISGRQKEEKFCEEIAEKYASRLILLDSFRVEHIMKFHLEWPKTQLALF